MMFRRIHNKKGFIFPFAYCVMVAMAVYVAAFANRALNDHNIAERNLLSLQIRYQTIRGAEFGIHAIKTNGFNWHTHTAVENGPVYDLVSLQAQGLEPPEVSLPLVTFINTDGDLEARDGRFKTRVYASPVFGTILLAQGLDSSGQNQLRAVKLHYQSLYDYFLFTPLELELSHITMDAQEGTMHSNRDIIFGDTASILNVAALSTPEAIRYYVETYLPGVDPLDPIAPAGYVWEEMYFWLRSPWVEPNLDGEYRNRNDGHLSGEQTGLLMESPKDPGKYIEYNPAAGNPALDPDEYPELYADSSLISNINGNEFPNRLDSEYLWDKYWRITANYGTDPVEVAKKFTNSELQPVAWSSLMKTLELDDIIAEANSGGEEIGALTISESDYKTSAQDNGIYIEYGELTKKFRVNRAGEEYIIDPGGQLVINDEVIFEHKTFFNTNSTNENVVLVAYVDKMIEEDFYPTNGIIFSDGKILLDNAKTLPDGGLTTLSKSAIYIKGNYNTEDWQPSAAIAAGRIYLLSDIFNYPQTLPDTFHHIERPYEEDFVEGKYNWYEEHEATMANPVDEDYTYVVSLIGYFGYMPEALERWWDYENEGSLFVPPSGLVEHKRHVIGSLIRLPYGTIAGVGVWDDVNNRGSRERTNPGQAGLTWPDDMGSVEPKDANNYFSYDNHYISGSGSIRPPGDFTNSIKLDTKLRPKVGTLNTWTQWLPELN
ncbi:MAG: hypothetical protein ABH954_01355 [Candidatus Omnitrophota bacterium]